MRERGVTTLIRPQLRGSRMRTRPNRLSARPPFDHCPPSPDSLPDFPAPAGRDEGAGSKLTHVANGVIGHGWPRRPWACGSPR